MEELIEENAKLKEKIKELESIINSNNSRYSNAYNIIRGMIVNKVEKEVDLDGITVAWERKSTRQRAERRIMSDLKWNLRVRTISEFNSEHIEKAKEYIDNYVIPEELKMSRWRNKQ